MLLGYSGGLTCKGARAAPSWLLAKNHRLQSYRKERNPDNELNECGFGSSSKDRPTLIVVLLVGIGAG